MTICKVLIATEFFSISHSYIGHQTRAVSIDHGVEKVMNVDVYWSGSHCYKDVLSIANLGISAM